MNLTKLFNYKYFKENLKKSKGIILLMIVFLPMFTVLQLMNATSIDVYSFMSLSAINIFLTYIVPFLLSLSLFGYVYKRTSVDFMGSMPISRKTIFATNTIGGIAVILLIQFITFILTIIMSQFIDAIVFTKLAFDVFIYQTLAYIFIFSISNLAMSVSGNLMTQLVVAVLLFLVYPVVTFYISEMADVNIEFFGLNMNYYQEYNAMTLPLMIIIGAGNPGVFSIVKTIILSIVYILLGSYLFDRRKMEKAGESFISDKAHLITKGLTLIPFVILAIEIFDYADFSEILLLVAIIMVYWFVYDLITAKKVKLTKNLTTLVIAFVALFASFESCIAITEEIKDNINIDDIDYLIVCDNNYYYDYSSSLSYAGKYEERETYKITDKDDIEKVLKYIKKEEINRKSYEDYARYQEYECELKAYINPNEYVSYYAHLEDRFVEKLIPDAEKYEEEWKLVGNATCFNNYKTITDEERKQIIELAKTMTPTEIRYDKEYFYTNEIDNLIVVQYVNHRTETITYNIAENEQLNDLVHKVVAREMAYLLDEEDINYIDIDFRWADQTVDKGGYDYHIYSEEECEDFAEYIEEEFLDDKVDYKKDYYVIRVEFENSNLSIAIKTNEVQRIREIMAKMRIEDQDYYYRMEKEIYETVTAEEITVPTVVVEPAVVNDEVFEIVE